MTKKLKNTSFLSFFFRAVFISLLLYIKLYWSIKLFYYNFWYPIETIPVINTNFQAKITHLSKIQKLKPQIL